MPRLEGKSGLNCFLFWCIFEAVAADGFRTQFLVTLDNGQKALWSILIGL